ncbi:hypothetical protein E2N92_00625 [Methanofollis formosanus]|uniref:Uncharacterized protein n=1 Tax=Methanofollis formosanus TaxID=299308 RepID=A0A8G0ZZJ9_9EURY|nr:hypothetical protein [Methanofollis formosanus]QYZ78038.1 hypothetical protein E2N92_00625 [Methanofollis formosanus]
MTALPDATSCPYCGGPLPPEERQAPSLCDACLAKIEREARPVLFTSRITRDQALDIVQTWWEDPLVAGDLATKAQTIECRLNYLPFWKLTAHVAGHVTGDDNSEDKVPMDVALDNDFVWTGAAGDTGGLGIYYLRNLIGETVSSDACTARVAETTVPPAEGFAEGLRALRYGALRYSGVPHVTADEVRLRPLEGGLVVYPFWIVRYAYAGRNYFATVDGVTGDLVSGRAPGTIFRRAFAFVKAMAATVLAVLVGILCLELLFNPDIPDPEGSLAICVIYIIFAIFVFSFGIIPLLIIFICVQIARDDFAFSRYGAEITYGEVNGGYRSSSKHLPSENTVKIAAIILGFCSMVIGGFVLYHWGKWQALVAAVAGLVAYIIACISLHNPTWGTASRRWVHEDYPVEEEA